MQRWTKKELIAENEKKALGLQYTIAERERLKLLWRMAGRILTSDNASSVARIMECLFESPSERFQDIFALLLSGGKREGFFVEFGACDGVYASNTLMLERYFAWRGILAEPATIWHEALKRNRTAKIDTRCVSSTTGDQLELHQSVVPGNSSIDRNHPYLMGVEASYVVPTVSLMDLLKEHGAPRYIDFMSVDTEGHESEVLRDFDFDRYQFGFVCVEQHAEVPVDGGVSHILENAGYIPIIRREEGRPIPMQISGIDMFFVREQNRSALADIL